VRSAATTPSARRYKTWTFWLSRAVLAVLAGSLAVAYDIKTPLLALNVGASAPLLYRVLTRGIRNPHEHQGSASKRRYSRQRLPCRGQDNRTTGHEQTGRLRTSELLAFVAYSFHREERQWSGTWLSVLS
jgi:hypothetical protein